MANEMNTISFSLYENKLINPLEGQSFVARVKPRGKVTMENLVDMITMRNSTVTKQEVAAVLDLLNEVIKYSVQNGYNVVTDIFSTSVSIKGVFTSMTDEYDPARHSICVNVRPGTDLKNFLDKNINPVKSETRLPVPALYSIYDYVTDETNGRVTPGNTAALNGNNLQFDPEAVGQGLYASRSCWRASVAPIPTESR